jgi:hypothetical protein
MRELKLDADQSHHLLEDARSIWSPYMRKAQLKLKKQQEQELQKRAAEGQPGRGGTGSEAREADPVGRHSGPALLGLHAEPAAWQMRLNGCFPVLFVLTTNIFKLNTDNGVHRLIE